VQEENAVAVLPGDGEQKLTARQKAFVGAFVSGETAGNIKRSALAAGYSETSAGQIGCATIALPHVAAAIDAALRAEIGITLTAQAVAVMRGIINDEAAPIRLRGDMAAKVVEYSGIVDRVRIEKARQTGLDGAQAATKRLGEMTRAELEAVCHQGAAILTAAAALPAPGQTIDAQVSAQHPAEAAE
jgi:hypothetical protein